MTLAINWQLLSCGVVSSKKSYSLHLKPNITNLYRKKIPAINYSLVQLYKVRSQTTSKQLTTKPYHNVPLQEKKL